MKLCSQNGCLRRHCGHGLCELHLRRFKKHGDINCSHKKRLCSILSCNLPHESKGYCHKHYLRFKKYGDATFVKCIFGEDRNNNKLYSVYISMKKRCYNINHKTYHNRGGRGIKVCDRWLGIDGFSNFLIDMGERPKGYSIDRINVNGDYSPDNCKRSNQKEQCRNKRNNIKINGKCIVEVAEDKGITPITIYSRIRNGWSIEDAINKPIRKNSRRN